MFDYKDLPGKIQEAFKFIANRMSAVRQHIETQRRLANPFEASSLASPACPTSASATVELQDLLRKVELEYANLPNWEQWYKLHDCFFTNWDMQFRYAPEELHVSYSEYQFMLFLLYFQAKQCPSVQVDWGTLSRLSSFTLDSSVTQGCVRSSLQDGVAWVQLSGAPPKEPAYMRNIVGMLIMREPTQDTPQEQLEEMVRQLNSVKVNVAPLEYEKALLAIKAGGKECDIYCGYVVRKASDGFKFDFFRVGAEPWRTIAESLEILFEMDLDEKSKQVRSSCANVAMRLLLLLSMYRHGLIKEIKPEHLMAQNGLGQQFFATELSGKKCVQIKNSGPPAKPWPTQA